MSIRFGFYMNMESCYGCKTCEVACKSEKKLPKGVQWRKVKFFQTETPPSQSSLTMACNHCENPVCTKVCPVNAYSKRSDGIVVQNHEACIGCQACIEACPYKAPIFDEKEGKVSKCDYCADRIDLGGEPRCSEACPMDCLLAGDLTQLRARYGSIRAVKDTPTPDLTGPAIVINPTKATKV